ncbi:MBL fold metallo-hydrolase [Bdellovibrionota bacterium FG-1]
MKIIVHRGTHEIGGTCIELESGGKRILIDVGIPLSPSSKFVDIAALGADAVLISHPHSDHFGLLDSVPEHIPVYIGALAKDLIDATRIFLDRPLHSNSFQFFEKGVPFPAGPFRVTPFLMDHSAVDAYGFLIEAEGKRLFYSGDFRGHGKKRVLFERFVGQPPGNIDVLFMEGTMLNRGNSEFPDEGSVEAKICSAIADQHNAGFLICSSQNIDRLVAAHNACVASDKVFVIDFYTAWVLDRVSRVSPGIRAFDWNHIAVLRNGRSSGRQYGIMKTHGPVFLDFIDSVFKHVVTEKEIRVNPSRYLLHGKIASAKKIETFISQAPVTVLYSEWLGYLKAGAPEQYGSARMAEFQKGAVPGVKFVYAHTSGHAVVADLVAYVRALAPKVLIPIHTEFPDQYKMEFTGTNVVCMRDGKTFSL